MSARVLLAGVLGAALLAAGGCGKYGPPERIAPAAARAGAAAAAPDPAGEPAPDEEPAEEARP